MVFRAVGMACVIILCSVVSPAQAAESLLVGTVTARYGNQIVLKTNTAASYQVEASYAPVVRKNGSPLVVDDVLVGDKLEVRGEVWADNSVTAHTIRDVSVYTHTGTYSGKVTAVDPVQRKLVLQNSQDGLRTVHTTVATVFSKNGTAVEFKDMQVGMSATVRGTWERSRQDVVATSVRATVRLRNIDITGEATMKNGQSFTVVAQGVLYAVDASNAVFKSKNNKSMAITEAGLGPVRVWGKHIGESPNIKAERFKYVNLVK